MKREEIIKKMVGIPWKFLGTDENGADCIGIAHYFYKLNGWKETFRDDKGEIEKDWYIKTPLRLFLYMNRNFNKETDFEKLEYGDIAFLKINQESHLGIVLPYGRILHTFPPLNEYIITVSHIERFGYLEPYFITGYKRRK